jgi:hypothetical protein
MIFGWFRPRRNPYDIRDREEFDVLKHAVDKALGWEDTSIYAPRRSPEYKTVKKLCKRGMMFEEESTSDIYRLTWQGWCIYKVQSDRFSCNQKGDGANV